MGRNQLDEAATVLDALRQKQVMQDAVSDTFEHKDVETNGSAIYWDRVIKLKLPRPSKPLVQDSSAPP
jgi:hypothetical protein